MFVYVLWILLLWCMYGVYVHQYIHTHTHTYTHVCGSSYRYVCMCIYDCSSRLAPLYVCVCVCVHVLWLLHVRCRYDPYSYMYGAFVIDSPRMLCGDTTLLLWTKRYACVNLRERQSVCMYDVSSTDAHIIVNSALLSWQDPNKNKNHRNRVILASIHWHPFMH